MFLGITPVSSVSNGLYFLTLPLVSVMCVIKRNIEKVWGACYTLGARYLYIIRDAEKVCGARYLPKNTVIGKHFPTVVSRHLYCLWPELLPHLSYPSSCKCLYRHFSK
jgi:hypothetical protein